ncbi:hypothetical protein PPYR_10359 [Photinus pyralis]|uniref:Nuclear receptor domain-containing protein n=1 Tax=Photinus pyralis TaxID=7054 RepID=A0A5N4AGF9_PHOPY|nr:protein embryonic gonad-like [Photinus pyralis]KAB0796298.1 hypothetical protein PPYR_10359 [Photinus pyralis]
MNQQCKVCGEPAAGFHFGAFTCEGCKSFFGRTYNNISSISECKNNGQCVINKKNRTACKACRLRKCLLVGMSKSGSRYGRRSNWFKIHCLLQEQQQQGININPGLLRPHPYLPLLRNPPLLSSDTKSSESDSGASSADLEDDVRSTSGLSCFRFTTSPAISDKSTVSSKKLPSPSSDCEYFPRRPLMPPISAPFPIVSPSGTFPRWLPTFSGLGDSSPFRDLWLKGGGTLPLAETAPEQEHPIDLSVRSINSKMQVQSNSFAIDESEIVKPVPLDLTLDRQADIVTN